MNLISVILLLGVGSGYGFSVSRSTFVGTGTLQHPSSTTLSMNIESVSTKPNIRVGVIGECF
jgi:hypothetical protein